MSYKAEIRELLDQFAWTCKEGSPCNDHLEAAIATARDNWQDVLRGSSDPASLSLLWEQDPLAALQVIIAEGDTQPIGELLTVKQAAEVLAISEVHLARITKDGTLPCIRVGERAIRYSREALHDFIRRGGVQ